jgi:uncharacterized protein VirK/YbjX
VDFESSSTVLGRAPLWDINGAAQAPAVSYEPALRARSLNAIRLLRLLLVNAAQVHPNASLNEIRRQIEFYAREVSLAKAPAGVPKGSGLTSLKHQLKFFFRGLGTPQLTQSWFDVWRLPKLSPLATLRPRVLLKLQRRYLRQGMDARQRWSVLEQHYDFAIRRFSAGALREIFTGAGVRLATLPAMEAGEFSIRLLYDNLFEKEGELSLVFFEEKMRRPLFALSFCISCCRPEQREIFIGGLQGYKGVNGREYMVSITREMHGLRPKALLLFALQQLATHWGVRHLRAVSNETRVRRRDNNIKADYDEFWTDSGGRLEGGNFDLPVEFATRDLAGIKANKRAMYRRRYRMLEELGFQIRQGAGQLEEKPPVSRVPLVLPPGVERADGSFVPAIPQARAGYAAGSPMRS